MAEIAEWARSRLSQCSREWNRISLFDWKATAACIAGGILLFPLVNMLPMLGYDWGVYFAQGRLQEYPPWAFLILWPLMRLPWRSGLALLNGLLLMTVAVATAREDSSGSRLSRLIAACMALLSPPTLILLWQGNIGGLVLLGLVALPWGLPLALLHPHLTLWAVLSNRRWTLWTLAFLLLSLILWQGWPMEILATLQPRGSHPMAMGWSNLHLAILLIGLALIPLARADHLILMSIGAFLSPYLLPQHFLLILPAIGRAQGRSRLLLWLLAWLSALPAMFSAWTAYLTYFFPLAIVMVLRGSQPERQLILDAMSSGK